MVVAAFAACSRRVKSSRRLADDIFDDGIAWCGSQEALIAGAHIVKTPAFDWGAGLNFQALRVNLRELGRDRWWYSFIHCGSAMVRLRERLRFGVHDRWDSPGEFGIAADVANLAGRTWGKRQRQFRCICQGTLKGYGHKKPDTLRGAQLGLRHRLVVLLPATGVSTGASRPELTWNPL